MTAKSIFLIVSLVLIIGGLYYFNYTRSHTQSTTLISSPAHKLANPASTNCIQKGGTLNIQKRGDGGEYGVCMFEDDQACEEWALMRGNCPVGGIKTIGYDTDAQKYCALIGGKTVAEKNATCTLPDGIICSNEALYSGKCPS